MIDGDIRIVLSAAAIMFCLGVYGLLSRRNTIGVLLCLELMANAANLNLVAFARYVTGTTGQVFTLFAIALTVAEVVVGLAIAILLHRTHRSTSTWTQQRRCEDESCRACCIGRGEPAGHRGVVDGGRTATAERRLSSRGPVDLGGPHLAGGELWAALPSAHASWSPT